MTRIVVFGVGGMGREVAAWATAAGRADDLVGFLDDDRTRHGGRVADLPVLGGREWLADADDVEVALGIGSPAHRAALLHDLDELGIPVCTIVHPGVVVGSRTTVGAGSILSPGVVLTSDVVVGRGVICNYGALVGHDAVVGDAAFLAPGVHVGGDVTIGTQADLGIGASVIQGITIGARAVVGAGAAVIDDVPADTTVVGVPARVIAGRGSDVRP